jgi:sugar phosphate isomerase/epimerase
MVKNKMTNNKILISSSAKGTVRESVLLAEELGTGIEISRVPIFKTRGMTVEETIDILNNDLGSFKNRITLHAMFSDLNISTSDYLLRDIAEKRYNQSLEIGKGIKADTILFHTGYKGTKHYGSIETFQKNFVSFWKEFVKEFEKVGIIAVIENVFETSPSFCLGMYNQIESDNLKLAIDAGHVNLYAQDTVVSEWLNEYGDNLYHMHIHNNFRKNDDHAELCNGTLDYSEILKQIKESNVNPSFVFEMFTEDNIRKSVEFFKKIYK